MGQLGGSFLREDEAVYEAILQAIRGSEAACIATVIETHGSTPRAAGAKMLVRSDGSLVGTVGGGSMEAAVVLDAQSVLRGGQSRLGYYSLLGEAPSDLGACGGAATVFLEVLRSMPTLVVAGAGHVAEPLVAFASMVGFRVVVVDDRPDLLTPERFPRADQLVCANFDQLDQRVSLDSRTAVVIVTAGHQHDLTVLRQAVRSPVWYVGMIGSRRKVQTLFDQMLSEGTSQETLAQVHAPIGLRTGGQTPAEIALSIAAELMLVLNGGDGDPCSWRDNPMSQAETQSTSTRPVSD
jgi:xanthine dehydrogenase accessory factor